MKLKLFLSFLTIVISLNLLAQSDEHSVHNLHHHEHHQNEIGIAYSPVYLLEESKFASGVHIHYSHSIPNSKFGIGLGYERILGSHKHNNVGPEVIYRPIEKLSFSLSPGLTFEDNSSEMNFAVHLETVYEFEIGDFHVGPALEFAYEPEDFHVSLGVHLGYGF